MANEIQKQERPIDLMKSVINAPTLSPEHKKSQESAGKRENQ